MIHYNEIQNAKNNYYRYKNNTFVILISMVMESLKGNEQYTSTILPLAYWAFILANLISDYNATHIITWDLIITSMFVIAGVLITVFQFYHSDILTDLFGKKDVSIADLNLQNMELVAQRKPTVYVGLIIFLYGFISFILMWFNLFNSKNPEFLFITLLAMALYLIALLYFIALLIYGFLSEKGHLREITMSIYQNKYGKNKK